MVELQDLYQGAIYMHFNAYGTITDQVTLNALHRAEYVRTAAVPRKAKLSKLDRSIRDARVARTATALRAEQLSHVLSYMPLA